MPIIKPIMLRFAKFHFRWLLTLLAIMWGGQVTWQKLKLACCLFALVALLGISKGWVTHKHQDSNLGPLTLFKPENLPDTPCLSINFKNALFVIWNMDPEWKEQTEQSAMGFVDRDCISKYEGQLRPPRPRGRTLLLLVCFACDTIQFSLKLEIISLLRLQTTRL